MNSELEIFPFGLESLIVLKLGTEWLSWDNITSPASFTHRLFSYQDTYQLSNNRTYYQNLDDSNQKAGRYIENDLFGSLACEELIWHSQNKSIILNDLIESENIINLTSIANNVIGYNLTTKNIERLSLSSASETILYSLGSNQSPIYNVTIDASSVFSFGENLIYHLSARSNLFYQTKESSLTVFDFFLKAEDWSYAAILILKIFLLMRKKLYFVLVQREK